jgi:hypothetical protein
MTMVPTTAGVEFSGGAAEVVCHIRMTGRTHIHCCIYPDAAPILAIDDDHVRISVTVPESGKVTADHIAWGYLLADAVAVYVAELEHRAAIQAAPFDGEAA